MAKLAIMGFGTVGSGIPEILQINQDKIARRLGEELQVKYILDIRDFSAHPQAKLFVKDLDIILADEEVRLVVESIGGLKPALGFVQRCLQSGRHVVTSNKELVAAHGAELLALAKENSVCFLFEASVGGGMPLITPLYTNLAVNKISAVAGILNGTTNFMLTQMENEGLDFDEALKLAQKLGYAETADPSSDVDGLDAARKIAILASLCFGSHVYPENVPADGIRKLTSQDTKAARMQGAALRLIAWACKDGDGLHCGVEPMMVANKNPLAGVSGVYNAAQLECDMLETVQFYGQGAGRLPTASAIVSDSVDALLNGTKIHGSLFWSTSQPMDGLYKDNGVYSYYLRAQDAEKLHLLNDVQAKFKITVNDKGWATVEEMSAEELPRFLQTCKLAGCEIAVALKWRD